MLLFLSGLPLWAAILLLVVLPTLLAMCGPILVRRSVSLEHLTSNNEIAGFKFATVGVIYAVLVAFAVIVVWEKFSEAQAAVVKEAGASETLYRLWAGPDPKMIAIRADLSDYLKLAVERVWPSMAREKESHEVTAALDSLYAAALRLTEGEAKQPALLIEMFKQLDSITEARRTRLHLATGVVPNIIWLVLFTGAVLTVVFTFFFGTRNLRAQVLMTGILSAITFSALLAMVEIDHPFTGPSIVRSDTLKAVLEEFPQQK
ncbi:MAG: DUF4239 domain-containing protein [Rhodomicrobium sp.]